MGCHALLKAIILQFIKKEKKKKESQVNSLFLSLFPEDREIVLEVGAASETPSPQRWRHSPGDAKTLGVSWGL